MSNQFTQVTRTGFFSRIANSIVGVFIGLLMIPGSATLLGWNEYRTIHRTKGLNEAEKVMVEIADPEVLEPNQDGKLVHLVGKATTDDSLSDPQFGLSRVALRYARTVEMYQWVEHKSSKSRDKIGGGRETVTTYDYNKRWEKDRVSSESFHESTGHVNPQPKFNSLSLDAPKVHIGAHRLSDSLVDQIDSWSDVVLDKETLLETLPNLDRSSVLIEGNRLIIGVSKPSSSEPQLGDLRIQFEVVEPTIVSVLTGQKGSDLNPFKTSNGEPIEKLVVGSSSGGEMIEGLKRQNSFFAWMLRIAGWVIASVGFGLIAGPLSAMASIVPIFGRLTGSITFFVSVVLGALLSIIVIAIAWFAVRPLLASVVLILAAAAIYFLGRRKKSGLQVADDGVLLLPK